MPAARHHTFEQEAAPAAQRRDTDDADETHSSA
jgi:hypothetical protein